MFAKTFYALHRQRSLWQLITQKDQLVVSFFEQFNQFLFDLETEQYQLWTVESMFVLRTLFNHKIMDDRNMNDVMRYLEAQLVQSLVSRKIIEFPVSIFTSARC